MFVGKASAVLIEKLPHLSNVPKSWRVWVICPYRNDYVLETMIPYFERLDELDGRIVPVAFTDLYLSSEEESKSLIVIVTKPFPR